MRKFFFSFFWLYIDYVSLRILNFWRWMIFYFSVVWENKKKWKLVLIRLIGKYIYLLRYIYSESSLFYKFPMSDYVMDGGRLLAFRALFFSLWKSRIKPVHVTIILLANPKSPIITNIKKILKREVSNMFLRPKCRIWHLLHHHRQIPPSRWAKLKRK